MKQRISDLPSRFRFQFAMLGFFVSAVVLGSADYYVTPSGAGAANGTSWANAFSNVQSAVTLATGSGDVIYLRYGNYTNAAEISISAAPGLFIKGGYAGDLGETPGALANEPSVLTRVITTNRIINAVASTVTVERVTIADGYLAQANAQGAGLRLLSCRTTLSNCVVRGNTGKDNTANTSLYGGAIYASTGSLALIATTVASNELSPKIGSNLHYYGAGIYAQNIDLLVTNCVFQANRTIHLGKSNYEYYGYGGGLYLVGGTATIAASDFTGNYCQIEADRKCDAMGGALYADGVNPIAVRGSHFRENWARADNNWPDTSYDTAPDQEGGLFYLTGASLSATITDCEMTRNAGPAGIGDLAIKNGTADVARCLIALNAGGGVTVNGGKGSIANCTLADNLGWGVTKTAGSLAISNSIAWGNTAGGIDAAGAAVGFTCSQELHPGTTNLAVDPRFVADYYLSVSGLVGQNADSPCIGAGNGVPADYGLAGLTTRTDGSADGGAVDLGYHYAGGFGENLSNLVLYVDAAAGDNANDGWSAGQSLRTVTEALDRAVPGSLIHVASGIYTQRLDETFPLTVQDAHVSLIGTNPATTVLDAAGAGTRVLDAEAQGPLRLESLTFRNGSLALGDAAGLQLLADSTVLSNCVVCSNTIVFTANPGTVRGGGIFAAGGDLTLEDCTVRDNVVKRGSSAATSGTLYGGGLYCEDVGLSIVRSTISTNGVSTGGNWNYDLNTRGGGMFAWDGAVTLTDSIFTNNYNYTPHPRRREALGGAIYAFRVGRLTAEACDFAGNWCGPWKYTSYDPKVVEGGTLYIAGQSVASFSRCRFANNRNDAAAPDQGDVRVASSAAELWMTNCLVAGAASNGISAVAGILGLVNCTVADNDDWGVSNGTAAATILNCIVWGNRTGGLYTNADTVIDYTDAQETHPGGENPSADPLFKNPALPDYRLSPGSPCLNAGTNETWMSAAFDLDGNKRLAGSQVDMGAYELLARPSGLFIMIR